MRTKHRMIDVVTVSSKDVGLGEFQNEERRGRYMAIDNKIWASRNDTRRAKGAPLLTHRLTVKSSTLRDQAMDPKITAKYAEINGVKYVIESITEEPNGYDSIIELGEITE